MGEVSLVGPLGEDDEEGFGADEGGDGDTVVIPDPDGKMTRAFADDTGGANTLGSLLRCNLEGRDRRSSLPQAPLIDLVELVVSATLSLLRAIAASRAALSAAASQASSVTTIMECSPFRSSASVIG